MSKGIYIGFREELSESSFNEVVEKLRRIEKKILPDNIVPNKVKILKGKSSIACIFNPVDHVRYSGTSLCLGFVNDDQQWFDFQTRPCSINGTYAIFREDSDNVELLTDSLGTRTVWYYHDEEKLLASTSQLAIIYYLESYEFNRNVIPWVLSTGTLGPFLSWDKRISALKPNSTLLLDRQSWNVTINEKPIIFHDSLSDEKSEEELEGALADTFNSSRFKVNKWTLPLSGGYDSRGILLFLLKGYAKNIQTITWGTESALLKKDNDAYIAKRLAKHFSLPHRYFLTNKTNDSVETIFKRFLINGEGRIDHIGAYMDGFKIWKDLFESGVNGIIRGDEGFGWLKVYSEEHAKISSGLTLCADVQNLSSIPDKLQVDQSFPDYYRIREGESPEKWRDRLYHTFRIPLVLAALNDLKLSYVEVVNPLLFPSILKSVYQTSDHLRTDKKLFRKIIDRISPNVPYAKSGANDKLSEIYKKKEVVDYLKSELNKKNGIFPRDYLDGIVLSISKSSSEKKSKLKNTIIKGILKMLPQGVKQLLKLKVKSFGKVDSNTLAFRVFIVLKMNEIINENINKGIK